MYSQSILCYHTLSQTKPWLIYLLEGLLAYSTQQSCPCPCYETWSIYPVKYRQHTALKLQASKRSGRRLPRMQTQSEKDCGTKPCQGKLKQNAIRLAAAGTGEAGRLIGSSNGKCSKTTLRLP